MPNEELHQRTIELLKRLSEYPLSKDELSLLCWHCGVSITDLTSEPTATQKDVEIAEL